MGTNYIAPIWRMPENTNKDKLSNYSIDFDGSTDYIEISDNILGGLSNFSISVWYNADTQSGDRAVVGAWSSGVTQMLLYWDDPDGWRFLINNGTSTTGLIWGTGTTINTWNHIAITYDGSTISFYHNNGTPVTQAATGSIRAGSSAWRIGVDTSSTRYWDGELSQFCLFDYALSTDQITYLYNLNNPMVIDGGEPIQYLPLGDNSNPNAPGSFPNISVGADSVFDFTAGEYVQLDDNDLLSFGDGATDDPMSISVWCKTTDGTGNAILSKWGGGSPGVGYEYIFWIVGPNKMRLSLYGQNTTVNNVYRQTTTDVNTGEWTHVLATYDGRGGNNAQQGIKIYLNGVEESSYTEASTGNYRS